MSEMIGQRLPLVSVFRTVPCFDNGDILMGVSAKNGKVVALGGKQDPGETGLMTLIRETGEESGAEIVPYGDLLVVDYSFLHPRKKSPHYGFRQVVASMATIVGGELSPQAGEISELLRIPRRNLEIYQKEMTPTAVRVLGAFGLVESPLLLETVVRQYDEQGSAMQAAA